MDWMTSIYLLIALVAVVAFARKARNSADDVGFFDGPWSL